MSSADSSGIRVPLRARPRQLGCGPGLEQLVSRRLGVRLSGGSRRRRGVGCLGWSRREARGAGGTGCGGVGRGQDR